MSSMRLAQTQTNKYDRQIRLWGDQGQSTLQSASVCVIGATATATEILKNLVLPGIASFTIVDGEPVAPNDQAANFFLSSPFANPSSTATRTKSTNRAQAVVNAMYDLNESVQGSYVAVNPSSFLTTISSASQFLKPFSFVILTQRSSLNPVTRVVSSACAQLNIPLLYARSFGQIALIRLQATEHCVFNSRTDNEPPDLRLYDPFPELQSFSSSSDALPRDEIGNVDNAHVPFIHILISALNQFRSKHNGNLPKTRDEKDEFATIVRDLRPPACPQDAQNYAEALRFANLRLCHFSAAEIPYEVSNVLKMAQSRPLKKHTDKLSEEVVNEKPNSVNNSDVSYPSLPHPIRLQGDQRVVKVPSTEQISLQRKRAQWWACASAVAKFFEQQKYLPLSGSIPDMTADTASYIGLQRVYRARADLEARMVMQLIVDKALTPSSSPEKIQITNSNGSGADICNPQSPHSGTIIDDEVVKQFCKHVRQIRLVKTRTIVDEMDDASKSGFVEAARMEGAMDESLASTCASPFYVSLRAADIFDREFGRLPGTLATSIEDDISRMCALVNQVKDSFGLSQSDCPSWREVTEEIVRYAGVEIHCVAAFIGGVAAQEVVKVVTGQFVPIEDCIITNMASMTSVTFRT